MAEEVVVEDVSADDQPVADGYMELSVGDKKSFKPYWFVLLGSTLFYYKTELDAKPKGQIELSDAKCEQEEAIIVVRHGDKDKPMYIRTSREGKAKQWLDIMEQNRDKPAHAALVREEGAKEHRSLGYRAQKAIGSKFAGSKAGAATLTSADEYISKLTKALKKLVESDSGKEKADYIHRGISKLVVKAAIEWNRETVTVKHLRTIDTPLRAAFNMFDKLFQVYKRRKGSDMQEQFKAACDQLALAVSKVREMMKAHLTAKNMMLLQNIGDYLCNPQWWIDLWDKPDPDGHIENNLYELVHAMTRYTQMELPVDDDEEVVGK